MFREWPSRLPAWIAPVALHMPGRGIRLDRPAVHRWDDLLDLLLSDVQPHLSRPFAFFGHSMGALVALELAHTVRLRCGSEPLWLGVSACIAPARRRREAEWLDRPEEALLDELRRLDGTPRELLDNPEFLNLLLPAIRADFHLCGTYSRRHSEPLRCPISAFGGSADEISQERANLACWSLETSGQFGLEIIEGDHFFIDKRAGALLERVVHALTLAAAVPERIDA
jgi:surfactin synthase thioesterase subunit